MAYILFLLKKDQAISTFNRIFLVIDYKKYETRLNRFQVILIFSHRRTWIHVCLIPNRSFGDIVTKSTTLSWCTAASCALRSSFTSGSTSAISRNTSTATTVSSRIWTARRKKSASRWKRRRACHRVAPSSARCVVAFSSKRAAWWSTCWRICPKIARKFTFVMYAARASPLWACWPRTKTASTSKDDPTLYVSSFLFSFDHQRFYVELSI